MIDDIPFMIVDNQKIAPLRGASKMELVSAEMPNRNDRPFGIVDRVTISKEAMEKYRQLQTPVAADPPQFSHPSRIAQVSAIPLLTGSLKKNI